MSSIISCNQNIGIPVIQGAYQRWIVSGSQTVDEREDEDAPVKCVYLASRTCSLVQLELFAEPIIDDKSEFKQLAAQWRLERGSTSSTTEIVLCPSYQAIIGMGAKAVPLILAEMEAEGEHPDHWFWALQALTKADPVSEEDEGDFRKMAKSWLQWASRRYVW
jgi:hypothetical protein